MILRRKTQEPPAPPPVMLTSVQAQLAEIAQERHRVQDDLEEIPARERELLDIGADDASLDALAAERDYAPRALARLAVEERRLRALEAELEEQQRQADYREMRSRYMRAATAYIEAKASVLRLASELHQIVADARWLTTLPAPEKVPAIDLEWFRQALAAIPEELPPRPLPVKLYTVRFVEAWHLYSAGECAGFSAEVAWGLVASGIAAWGNLHDIPLPPVDPRKAPMPAPGTDGKVSVKFGKTWKPPLDKFAPAYCVGQTYRVLPGIAGDAVRGGYGVFVEEGPDDIH